MKTPNCEQSGKFQGEFPKWARAWPAAFLAGLVFLSLGGLLCGCNKSRPPTGAQQSASDADPERAVENRLRQSLTQVNAREGDVALLARAASKGLPGRFSVETAAEREKYYPADKYLEALRATGSAITNKMAALSLERAVLANSKETNGPGAGKSSTAQTGPVAPDERSEEMKLKARLMDLQSLNEELLITAPDATQLSAQTEEKAAQMRADMYSPEEYVTRLGLTADLLQKKLQALDAEAAFYDRILNPTNSPSGGR